MIWHYTDGNALLAILRSSSLWASSVRYLNDSSELTFGRQALASAIDAVVRAHGGANIFHEETDSWGEASVHSQPTEYYNLSLAAYNIQGSLGWETKFDETPDEYAISFSRKGDLLSQWRGYAKGSGFALGFSETSLARAWDGIATRVAVKYGQSAQNDLVGALEDLVAAEGADPSDAGLLALLRRACWYKDPSFAEEREVRFIVANPDPDSLRVRDTGDRLVPYIAARFPPPALRAIRVGPGRDFALDRSALEVALRTHGYGPDIAISRTQVPYRTA